MSGVIKTEGGGQGNASPGCRRMGIQREGASLKREKFTMPLDLGNELIIDCANFAAPILHRGHSINKQFTKAYRRSK